MMIALEEISMDILDMLEQKVGNMLYTDVTSVGLWWFMMVEKLRHGEIYCMILSQNMYVCLKLEQGYCYYWFYSNDMCRFMYALNICRINHKDT